MLVSPTAFWRWNENEPTCKESPTDWSQFTCSMPLSYHLSWAAKTVKTRSKYILIHSCSTNYLALINDFYYITLPMHSHAEITVVIANLGVRSLLFSCLSEWIRVLGMDWTWIKLASNDLSKCNSNSNFSSVSGFRKSANFNIICDTRFSSKCNSSMVFTSISIDWGLFHRPCLFGIPTENRLNGIDLRMCRPRVLCTKVKLFEQSVGTMRCCSSVQDSLPPRCWDELLSH